MGDGSNFLLNFSAAATLFLATLRQMDFAGSNLLYIFAGAFVFTAIFRNLGWFRYEG